MDIRFASKAFHAKAEGTKGVDSSPDKTNRIFTRDLAGKVYDGNRQQVEYDGDNGRNRPSVMAGEHSSFNMKFDFAGSGTNNIAPPYADILRACGVDVTVGASDVTYTIADEIIDSVSGYFSRDEGIGIQLYKSLGMQGVAGIEFARGQVPAWVVSQLMGSYIQPVYNPSALGGSLPTQVRGVPVSNANTTTASLDGVDVCLESLTLDNVGHSVEFYNSPNCNEAKAQPVPITGSITLKDEGVQAHNWVAKAESHAAIVGVPLILAHGTAAGNIMSIPGVPVQITDIDETEIQGVKAWNLKVLFQAEPSIIQT